MKDKLILTGVVMLAAPVGDYDKRLVILTRERGKITAFARGARKQNSVLLAACNPFVFGEIEVYEGRDAYTVARILVKNYFRELTKEPAISAYGFYFLELTNYFTRENIDGSEPLLLLYTALRALLKEAMAKRLIRVIVELKILVINGVYPDVFQCKSCATKEELMYLSKDEHGVLCSGCGRLHQGKEVDRSTIYALQYIISSKLDQLFNFSVTEKVLQELEQVVTAQMNRQVDRTFFALELIQLLK